MKTLTWLFMAVLLFGFAPEASAVSADLHPEAYLRGAGNGSGEADQQTYSSGNGDGREKSRAGRDAPANENGSAGQTLVWLTVGLLLFGLAQSAAAAPVNFHLKGALSGTLSGSGGQDQGAGSLVTVAITGKIWADIDESFALNVGESHFVDIGGKVQTSYADHSPYDLANAVVEAVFTPEKNVIASLLHPGLSLGYSPFYTLSVPGEHAHQGFGFNALQVSNNGQSFVIQNIGDSRTISLAGHAVIISPTRSTFGAGDLGAMGGFDIILSA
ncbi:hypothetical protein ACUUL3_08250 [Thiovibrio sp. JS02]